MTFLGSWQSYALASAFFAGLTALFGKLGFAKINSDLATFLRTVVILVRSPHDGLRLTLLADGCGGLGLPFASARRQNAPADSPA